MLCNYVTEFLEIGQMLSESTFTLSSDTFEYLVVTMINKKS